MRPIVDLHCDLLTYLSSGEGRSVDDDASRASVPQLEAGGVRLQVLAIFAPTTLPPGLPGGPAVAWGRRQVEAYRHLLRDAQQRVVPLVPIDDREAEAGDDAASDQRRIAVVPAFENASTFAAEDEPIADALARFESMLEALGTALYVGLTWADDNRFGGGNRSRRGLTDDGRRLLDYLATRRQDGRGGPAVDLAHASPWLAEGIIEHRTRTGSSLPMLVSHTSFQHFVDTPRNVDDDTAREVAAQGGVIGLNLMRWWNGDSAPDCFARQLRHARTLGLEAAFAMGADFFCTEDVPDHLRSEDSGDEFFADFANASCYPRLFDAFAEAVDGDEAILARIAHGNARRFIESILENKSAFPIDIGARA